jgi:hypothetical protein
MSFFVPTVGSLSLSLFLSLSLSLSHSLSLSLTLSISLSGTHPVWGDEYLCPHCRVSISGRVVGELVASDSLGLGIFFEPVTEAVAKNYFDIIRHPMDLRTMAARSFRGQYKSLQSVRQDFELMCLNALIFNKESDEYWTEAKAFEMRGREIFLSLQRRTQVSAVGY